MIPPFTAGESVLFGFALAAILWGAAQLLRRE